MDKNELSLIITTQAQQATASLKSLNSSLISVNGNVKNISVNATQMSNGFNKLGSSMKSFAKGLFSIYAIKKGVDYLYKGIQASIDYTETLNLFNTALGDNAQRGIKFQNELNESFGTNKEELMRSQGLYTAMSRSLGLASDQAYNLGENMTKLSLDLSSLYNKDIEKVNEALKSGLVGQTKAVRQLGMDITEKTLNQQLLTMGITDKTTAVMSQTEKVILRYIVMLKQATLSQADFAKTIESPANQLRILKQQLIEVSRWMGNLFYGLFKNVLPYINAFVMVIKEVIKSFALLFGYKDDNFGGAVYAEDMADNLGTADTNAKKLKNTLQSFDQIHNIETDTGDAGGSVGGIDRRLLEAMGSYDNQMSKVQMKATKIRDRIMEWLGFTKNTNSETGEVSFKLDEGYTKLELIFDIIKGIIRIGIISKLISVASAIVGPTGALSKLTGVVKGVGTAFSGLSKVFGALMSPIGLIIAIIAVLITAFVDLYKNNEEFRNKVNGFISDIKEGLIPIFESLKSVWKTTIETISSVTKSLIDNILKPLWQLLTTLLKPIFEDIINVLTVLWKEVILPLTPAIQFIIESGFKVLAFVLSKILFPIIKAVIDSVKLLLDGLNWLWTNAMKPLIDNIQNIFSPIVEKISEPFETALNEIKNAIKSVIDWWNNLSFNKKKIEVSYNTGGFGGGGGSRGGAFATGGFPTTGQMFIAREAGPELVGRIGGRTAVANNDQIVNAVAQGVAQAVAGTIGKSNNSSGPINIWLGDELVTDRVIKNINGRTQQYGVSPLR